MKYKLIGSARTYEDLFKLIKAKWGWKDLVINDDGAVLDPKTGDIIDGLRVVINKKRWRLEMRVF